MMKFLSKEDMNSDQDTRYRQGVGLMIINSAKQVFVGQRIDRTSDAWQMPQGGIDEGETPLDAAWREMEEEVGTREAVLVAESTGWIKYDLPAELIPKFWSGKFLGQQQKWFLMQLLDEKSIDINTQTPEFSSWKWVEAQVLPEVIVPFKKSLYQNVLKEFEKYLH